MSAAVLLPTGPVQAKGGSSVSVTTTATVTAAVVSGVVTVANAGSTGLNVSSVRAALEVRFPSGTTPPALPAGSSSGWYVVATQALPSPGTVPAKSSRSIVFGIDTCATGVAKYPGAKDMRATAVVTAGQAYSGRSLNFALPGKCPVCGNGVVEGAEQCDQGANGGGCCAPTCRFRADGTGCSDGNACTQSDQCQAGSCVAGLALTCVASDACHSSGTCNPATGVCSNPAKPNGTTCDDANACTRTDSCQSGVCRGANPVSCVAGDQCEAAVCNPATGTCSGEAKPDGTECIDGNACTVGDRCLGGTCVSGDARDCDDRLSCTDDACDEATGCGHEAASCDTCDAAECTACGEACDGAASQCAENCWSGFLGCIGGCTSTYCAPFCQADLSGCLASCPATTTCRAACEAGNGCTPGCVAPQ